MTLFFSLPESQGCTSAAVHQHTSSEDHVNRRGAWLERCLDALFRTRLIRHASTPHEYLHVSDVKGKSTDCPNCNPTARAIRYVLAQWVVAGIDKGEG